MITTLIELKKKKKEMADLGNISFIICSLIMRIEAEVNIDYLFI